MARRRDDEKQAAPMVERVSDERRIQLDLEVRGVPQRFARELSRELAGYSEQLSCGERESVLEGVALAFRAQRVESDRRSCESVEMQRLFQDFATELKRIDEGMRLLASYVIRIRKRVSESGQHTVH